MWKCWKRETDDKDGVRLARCVLGLSLAVFVLTVGGGRRPEAVPIYDERPMSIEEARIEREELRREELEELEKIILSSDVPEETRLSAGERIIALRRWMDEEAVIEDVLKRRGYAPLLVTVQAGSVNVLIESAGLERQEAAVILDLAARETGISGGNIKIIPII